MTIAISAIREMGVNSHTGRHSSPSASRQGHTELGCWSSATDAWESCPCSSCTSLDSWMSLGSHLLSPVQCPLSTQPGARTSCITSFWIEQMGKIIGNCCHHNILRPKMQFQFLFSHQPIQGISLRWENLQALPPVSIFP